MISSRNLYLFEDFEDEVAEKIVSQIHEFNVVDEAIKEEFREPICLWICSNGGEFNSLMAIRAAILMSQTPVYTIATGKAMSCGLILTVCGHKRMATKGTQFLFHGIAGGKNGYAIECQTETQRLIDLQDLSISIIEENSKLSKKKLNKMAKRVKDYFFDENKALKWGIIDEII